MNTMVYWSINLIVTLFTGGLVGVLAGLLVSCLIAWLFDQLTWLFNLRLGWLVGAGWF